MIKDVDKKINNKPLIRALAIRTMGCLRVKELNEYLINPLLDGMSNYLPRSEGLSFLRQEDCSDVCA